MQKTVVYIHVNSDTHTSKTAKIKQVILPIIKSPVSMRCWWFLRSG